MSKRIQTAKQNNFAEVVNANIKRSTFLRPSSLKTSFNCGCLVPIYSDEVLPGDTRKISIKALARLSTPLFPTMDNLDLEFYSFFVPNRLVWQGWEPLMGENKSGAWTPVVEPALVPGVQGDSDETTPLVSKGIGDYYGLPVGMDLKKYYVNTLRFRAYALIWNEWFRDENLQAPIPVRLGNYDTSVSELYHPNRPLLKVNKFHDYFTSALPAPLKGDSPLIPFEFNKVIPVLTSSTEYATGEQLPMRYRSSDGNAFLSGHHYIGGVNVPTSEEEHFANAKAAVFNKAAAEGEYPGIEVYPSNLVADPRNVTNMTSTTISELRTLFQIQKILERDARGGTRYVELLKSHFGVDAGDYRLQRPEFLGRYRTMVGIQSVPQTSATQSGVSPQGNLAAYSVTPVGSQLLVNKSFVEHGYIHIFAVVRQVKSYQQGLDKSWSRRERFDFYMPELAHISEQPILKKEIYALGSQGEEVFGYQEAWADYRFSNNKITGSMRTNSVNSLGASDTLDNWHYADWYEGQPLLSSEWITDNSDVNVRRTLATTEQLADQLRMDVEFLDVATRPMPVYSIPGLVDHF